MTSPDVTLLVVAKEPKPGRVKTRLSPPCSPTQAARLAEAALADTLAVVATTPATRRLLVLDGAPGPWLPDGFDVVSQRGEGLAERLADAFSHVDGPGFLVGMDTPQITPSLLTEGVRSLLAPGVGAALGPAADGGYWAIGLRAADPEVFRDVPMSVATTGAAQRARLEDLGLDVATLPTLTDVDLYEQAGEIAALAPTGAFAKALTAVDAELAEPAQVSGR
jgi:hypothetical protein